MFSHVMLGANDVEKSKSFYDAILGAIGYEPGVIDDNGRVFWMNKTGIFSISTVSYTHLTLPTTPYV